MLNKKKRKHSQTLTEKASLQIKENQLHRHMQTLLEVQKIYIPGVASLEAHSRAMMVASDGTLGILLFIHC